MQKVSLDILVVEEDKHWRQRFQQELERLGANVVASDSKPEALELAKKKDYDLYLSGGIMFCYRLKEMRPDANILFIPGFNSEISRSTPSNIPYIYKGEFCSVIYEHIQSLNERKAKT